MCMYRRLKYDGFRQSILVHFLKNLALILSPLSLGGCVVQFQGCRIIPWLLAKPASYFTLHSDIFTQQYTKNNDFHVSIYGLYTLDTTSSSTILDLTHVYDGLHILCVLDPRIAPIVFGMKSNLYRPSNGSAKVYRTFSLPPFGLSICISLGISPAGYTTAFPIF